MKLVSTQYRTSHIEIMDNFQFQGNELEATLLDLERINRILGGNQVILNGLEKLNLKTNRTIQIVDIGCGSGQVLREIAKWGRKRNLKLNLVGIDANTNTIEIAKKLTSDFPEISYKVQDVFSPDFIYSKFEIACISLTLHHFSSQKIKELLHILAGNTKLAIIINDLHRSKTAYYLFWLFCLFFVHSPIAKSDGLVSILRGFKRAELRTISKQLNLKKFQINWFWAFRYQWIIFTQPREQK